MKEINILIVEDESIVALELEGYIAKLGFNVTATCSSAKGAFEIISQKSIHLVLMDICIKGDLDGVEAAVEIKKSYPLIEVIFLTAHLDDYNVNRAIEIDPVAYLSKPFNREELRVFLKIAQRKINKEVVRDGVDRYGIVLDREFSYNMGKHTLYCCSEIIALTKKENELLELLLKNRNSVVEFYTIENIIWPDKETNINTIRTLVKRLRQKLKHKFIQTVSSRGYRLVADIQE